MCKNSNVKHMNVKESFFLSCIVSRSNGQDLTWKQSSQFFMASFFLTFMPFAYASSIAPERESTRKSHKKPVQCRSFGDRPENYLLHQLFWTFVIYRSWEFDKVFVFFLHEFWVENKNERENIRKVEFELSSSLCKKCSRVNQKSVWQNIFDPLVVWWEFKSPMS